MSETNKMSARVRSARRAGIRRGMRIALYEVQQMLKPLNVVLEVPPGFVAYTVDLAEGGRRAATAAERIAGVCAQTTGKSCSCHSTG